MKLFRQTPKFDFLGKRIIFFGLSLAVIIIGLAAVVIRGGNILSLDFTGGYLTQLEFEKPVELETVREALLSHDYGDVSLQVTGAAGNRIIIRTGTGGQDLINIIRETFPEQTITVLEEEEISPVMGQTIRKQTIVGFLLAIVGILIYISLRFEFRFAVAAVAALVHDLLVALALLAITGRRLDSIVIAAFLTITGYSVNDTVVVFDRVRENLRGLRKVEDIGDILNVSVNETLSRSIITTVSTLLAAGALFFLGGPVLHDFAFILMVGFISGTYSSIFIASATVAAWEKRTPHRFKT